MAEKSLPAYLKQVLETHVEQSDIVADHELEDIYQRLAQLNGRVEAIKRQIMLNRQQSNGGS